MPHCLGVPPGVHCMYKRVQTFVSWNLGSPRLHTIVLCHIHYDALSTTKTLEKWITLTRRQYSTGTTLQLFLKKNENRFGLSFQRFSSNIISIIALSISWHCRFIRAQKQSKKTATIFTNILSTSKCPVRP